MDSNDSDPLEKRITPERVNYRNGVLLDQKDFKDEQTYMRGRLSRALAFLHGSGTVAGLEVLNPETQPHVIMVMPGLAIDPVGRLIEVPVPYCIRAREWFAGQDKQDLEESFANSGGSAVVVDLFVKFNVCGRGMTPCFGVGNTEGTDAFAHERLLDGAFFEMEIRTEADPDKPAPDRFHGLPRIDPDNPPDLSAALTIIKNHKYTAWNEDMLNGEIDTRVPLSRIQLPSTENPMAYNTSGRIVFDDSVRLLSFTTTELFWLINTMRGDQA